MVTLKLKYSRVLLHTTALVAALGIYAPKAFAEPTGGAVTSGSAAITSSGTTTTINQSSDRAIIRWDTFDINTSEHVQFVQPSYSSITVNRIRDTKPSNIQGKISANGNIVLINPNGIVFGTSSVVDVGGLTATTSDIEDDNTFMNGGAVKFTKPGLPDAKVINRGSITVRESGLVGLVAPNVENHGIIQARLGKAQLASGDIHTIDFAGDGLIKLEVSDAVLSQSVTNTGTITADGGEILLTAAHARHLVDALVTNTGTLRADTVTKPDGTIKKGSIKLSTVGLDIATAPHSTENITIKPAQITNTGTISTNGNLLDQVGGDILILSDHILIGDGSYVTATGDSGGGSIRIGGDYQGGNGIPTSDMIYISKHVILNAGSTRRGNGGRIILWSDTNTRFYGHAEAIGDEGGFIEISSKGFLDFNGTADLRGRYGVNGTLLLDPTNITISGSADSNVTGVSPFTPTADTVTSVVNATTLLNALANGNVIVQTRATGGHLGTITVDTALNWISGSTLTLDAHNTITVNQAITANSGGLTMIAGADVILNADISGTGILTIQQRADNITFGVAGGAGTLNLSVADLTRVLDGWSNIVLGRDTATVSLTVNARVWTDNLTLQSGSGTINFSGVTNVGANNMTISTNGDINLPSGAALTGLGGTLTLQQSTQNQAISLGGGTDAIRLSNTEAGRITNGWGNIIVGRTDSLGTMTLGAVTWNDFITFQSGTGLINVTGVQTMGTNTLTFLTDGDITLGATNVLYGSTTLTFQQVSQNGTIGIGDGQIGTMQFTNLEIARIRDGWTNITFGRTDGTADINVGALTWTDSVSLRAGSGAININGIQTMATNALNVTTVGGNITTAGSATGTLTLNSGGGTITTTGTITAGGTTINSGGGLITLGSTLNATTLGITTGNNNLTTTQTITATSTTNINSGTGFISFGAAVSSGAGAMTLTSSANNITTAALTSGTLTVNTNNGNFATNGLITASGTVNITTGTGSINLGANASSAATAMNLTSTGNTITTLGLTSGSLTINSNNGNISIGSMTTSGIVGINSGTGSITITNASTSVANAMTLTSTGNTITTAGLTSGTLTINSNNGNITTGTITASGTTNVNSGTGTIIFGGAITSGSAAMNITTNNTAFTSNNTIGGGALTITTGNANIAINAAINATGTTSLNSGTGSINATAAISSGAGTLQFTSSGNTITTVGLTSGTLTINSNNGNITTGTITASGATNITSGTGSITISGGVTSGTNTVTLTSTNNSISTSSIASGGLTITTNGGNFNASGNIGSGAGVMNVTTTGGMLTTNGITSTTGVINLNSNGGTLTVGGAGLTSTSGAHTINSGIGSLIIDGAIAAGSTSLVLTTDSNIQFNANVAGTGTLTITQFSDNVSMGIGDGETGTVHLGNAEHARILSGWSSLALGRMDSTATMNVAALTWNANTSIQTGTGQMTIAGATMGARNLTLRTDSDIIINGNLSGSAQFALVQSSNNVSMGLGDGQIGTVNMDNAELSRIANGWTSLVFGRIDSTAEFNLGARSWVDPLTIRSGSGQMTIAGNQTMATNSLVIITDSDIAINGNLTSTGTGTLSIYGSTTSTTIALGTGETGTIKLDDTEMGRIMNAWAGIAIGSTAQTGTMNVGTRAWADPLTLRTGSGIISINGNLSMTGSNNLTITSDADVALLGTLAGAGSVTISGSNNATSISIGTTTAGTLNIDSSELTKIVDGWTNIIFGTTNTTGAMNIGAATWTDNAYFRTASGQMTVTGAQSMVGTANLSFQTNANLAINAALTGSGSLIIAGSSTSASLGVGTGAAGANNISDAELAFITDGWANLIFGATNQDGVLTINARTWADSVDFRTESGAIVFTGAQNLGANNLIIRTNTNLNLNQVMAGTGNITILGTSAGTTMGIGDGMIGTVNLTNTELANIANGWTNIVFGSTSMTGAMNVGSYSWNDNLILRSAPTAAGNTISLAGATMGTNNLTITTNWLNLTGALTGTGDLIIESATATNTMGVGTGSGGNLNLTDTEVGYLSNGWNSITLGSLLTTGTMNVNAFTWSDNLILKTLSGVLTVAGATMGSNNLTMQTNSNLAITGNILGSNTLTILPATASTSMGVGVGGTLSLSSGELGFLVDGWNNLVFGRADGTGAVTIAARTWADNVTIMGGSGTGGSIMTIAGATMGANNLTLITNSDLGITGALTGTGTLTIRNASGTSGIGVGTGQTGTTLLTNTELANFTDGWGRVVIGGEENLGVINIGAYSWVNPMSFITQGDVKVNGDQVSTEVSGNSLVFATATGRFINSAGSDALNPGGGRYLVYSVDALSDTLDGIAPSTIVTNKTYAAYGPGSVVESGNVHIYSGVVAKILYLTIDDVDKVYGDNNPIYTYAYVSGLQNGDLLTNIIASYSLDASGSTVLDNAGTTRTISGTFTLNNGYSYVLTTGTMTVIKADLTVEIDSDTREYGDANGTFTATYDGFRNGDDDTDINTLATLSTTANVFSNVGSYAITGTGASDNNYNFTYVNGSLEVTKATLVATSQNATREYGAAAPTYTFNYTGFRNGDVVGMIDTGATGSSAAITANVGNYAITGSGAFDNNYTFTYANTGQLSVTKATLTATTQNATREYGAADPTFTVAYTGFRNSDGVGDINTQATASTGATIFSNVGSYGISSTGASDNNYDFTYVNTGNLSITKATLTATTQNATREYGSNEPTFAVVYTGFRNGDDDLDIGTLATLGTSATIFSDVGNYSVNASAAFDDNYTFSYANTGNLSITKVMLTGTTQDATREYGLSNTGLTITYTGFRNGDTQSVIDTQANVTSTATLFSDVGIYGISASGAVDNNYDFTYVNTGNLSVTKAMLTVTADDKQRETSEPDPVFTGTYTGFRNGETTSVLDGLPIFSTTATNTSPLGDYAISGTGGLDNNYDFTYISGTLHIVLDSSIPLDPPPVIPNTPASSTPTTIPSTIDHGIQRPASFIYTNPLIHYNDTFSDKDMENPSIIFVRDDMLFSTASNGDYLIAISESLRGLYEFFDERNTDDQRENSRP